MFIDIHKTSIGAQVLLCIRVFISAATASPSVFFLLLWTPLVFFCHPRSTQPSALIAGPADQKMPLELPCWEKTAKPRLIPGVEAKTKCRQTIRLFSRCGIDLTFNRKVNVQDSCISNLNYVAICTHRTADKDTNCMLENTNMHII